MHHRPNNVACMQAIISVSKAPLPLSFTSSSEISDNSRGLCMKRSDAPFGINDERLEHGVEGLESLGSIAIPPVIARKLCAIVHRFQLERGWL